MKKKHPIEALIEQGEHQQLDFKFEVSDSKKIARTLSAFANTDGGRLLIGVKDNGAISGVRSEEEYYMIEAASKMYTHPEVPFTAKRWDVNGKTVLEVYIAPIENTMAGILIADVMGTGMGLLTQPIHLEIQDGKAYRITGGTQADHLRKKVENIPGGTVVAEFAIGLNPCATPTGSIVIDEGIYGTGHFALGSNTGFGGNNVCPQHLDLVYEKPTIYLDESLFMKDGVLTEL